MCCVAPASLARRFISSARERPICAPRNFGSIPNLLDPAAPLMSQLQAIHRADRLHDLCRGVYPLHHAVPACGRTPTVANPAGLPPTRATGQSLRRICSSRMYLQTNPHKRSTRFAGEWTLSAVLSLRHHRTSMKAGHGFVKRIEWVDSILFEVLSCDSHGNQLPTTVVPAPRRPRATADQSE